ncbi:MAG: hypothetical protein JOZ05_06730 [Acetobacteraceae bacterium]|nr:hypothetical protein [Acetobacteraceae bacterium]
MQKRRWIAALLALAIVGPAAAQQAQQAPNPSFNLVNRGNSAINEVYATSAGMATWGRNRLTEGAIRPGQSYPIRLPADGNCIYDIRVVYANGQADERRALNTCNVDNVTFPSGGRPANAASNANDPSFRLVNRSRSKVNEVYASVTGDDSWGEDRLGDDTVAPGATKVIRLPSGDCLYDIRVVFANGEATEKRQVNLCNITDLRVP